MAQLATFLENLDATTNSAVLTEKLADLYDAQGKPSSAIETYQIALKLNPSPEQRIRLRLTLGDKLQAEGRETEAVENYQQLLAESPDYPGREFISQHSGRALAESRRHQRACQTLIIHMAIFFDTHAHLDYPDYAPDLTEVVARAQAAGITKIISIGTDLESSERAIALAEKFRGRFCRRRLASVKRP